jgi:hypothetical protein
MKRLLSMVVPALTLLPANVRAADPAALGTATMTFEVHATRYKPGGLAWDILDGAPDLQLCYTHAGAWTCAPAVCTDSYRCRWEDVSVDSPQFSLLIGDQDESNNDTVATANCLVFDDNRVLCTPVGSVQSLTISNVSVPFVCGG